MALSDCPKCWETPCGCGHAYQDWTPARRAELAAAVLGTTPDALATIQAVPLVQDDPYPIKRLQAQQHHLAQRIDRLVEEAIPDFHFLSHKVSESWDCTKSPIGRCVWDIRERGFHLDCCCYYCGDPVERK